MQIGPLVAVAGGDPNPLLLEWASTVGGRPLAVYYDRGRGKLLACLAPQVTLHQGGIAFSRQTGGPPAKVKVRLQNRALGQIDADIVIAGARHVDQIRIPLALIVCGEHSVSVVLQTSQRRLIAGKLNVTVRGALPEGVCEGRRSYILFRIEAGGLYLVAKDGLA